MILSLMIVIFGIDKRGIQPQAVGIVPGITLTNETLYYGYYMIMYK